MIDPLSNSNDPALDGPEREPVEITSGEPIRVEFAGQLKLTRMEYQPGDGYYTVDGYPLRDGLRAAIGEHG